MNRKMRYDFGRDILISVFLIVTMIARCFTENVNLFAFFALVSLFAAIFDIYITIEKEYIYYRRFYVVRGAFIVGGILSMIVLAVLIIFKWKINSLVMDELSILALLVSLPKELICYLLGMYIQGKKEIE